MDLGLKGKVALVTGGSKGIGAGVARVLAEEGCTVHIAARSPDDLQATAERLVRETGAAVVPHACDLADSGAIAALLAETGIPDILVNNAGAIPAGTLEAVDEARWRDAWDLKVFGYINMCRAVCAEMRTRGSGVIVNVTGFAAERTDADYIAGTAGNAGLNAFTRALGSRSLNDGVRVLAVSPGAVETERLVGLMKTRAEAEFGDRDRWSGYLAALPLGRAATVREVADTVAFAASERASYLSGIVITVDGGHGANNGSFT